MRVVRSRFFFNHSSPSERSITEEVTLYNDSNEPAGFVIISLPDFREGLRVLDFDDSDLAFYPKDVIRKEIAELEKSDKVLFDRIDFALKNKHLLWIAFPEGKSIRSNELRVIKLVYHDKDDVKYVSTFFNVPQFIQTKQKLPTENYDTFYFVKAPTNYELHFERLVGDNLPQRGVYEGAKKSLISIRLPASTTSYCYEFRYEVGLGKAEQAKWIGLTLGLSLLSLSLILISQTGWLNAVLLGGLGTAILTISTAMLALLNDPVTQKTKWLLLIPIALAIILITITAVTPIFSDNSSNSTSSNSNIIAEER